MANESPPDLRGGGIGRRDRWFGMDAYDDFPAFRHWWHRIGKRALGRNLQTREEAIDADQEFIAERRSENRWNMHLESAKAPEETATAADRFGEAAFIRIINQASSKPSSADLWRQAVAQIIVATTSNAVRDAAAPALVDLGGRDGADALVEVLRRPELARHNGTLVSALYELGAHRSRAIRCRHGQGNRRAYAYSITAL